MNFSRANANFAASALLVKNAGGKVTTPQGMEWNAFEPDILASNGVLHDEVLNRYNAAKK